MTWALIAAIIGVAFGVAHALRHGRYVWAVGLMGIGTMGVLGWAQILILKAVT